MSTLAGDFWVCGECRSINNAGAKQCYNCRTPRTARPSTRRRSIRRPRQAARDRAPGVPIVARHRRARHDPDPRDRRDAGRRVRRGAVSAAGPRGIAATGPGRIRDARDRDARDRRLALIGWSLWLSRAVSAMPALGLGYPAPRASWRSSRTSSRSSTCSASRRSSVTSSTVSSPKAGGEAVIFAAWIALLGRVRRPADRCSVSDTSCVRPRHTAHAGRDRRRRSGLVTPGDRPRRADLVGRGSHHGTRGDQIAERMKPRRPVRRRPRRQHPTPSSCAPPSPRSAARSPSWSRRSITRRDGG